MQAKKIVVAGDQIGWHTECLVSAFENHACEVHTFSLSECEFFIENGVRSMTLPEFGDELPDAVFVRCIPQGSFEQITFYLSALHALEARGVLIYNRAQVIERSVDKVMATFLLAQAGLPTPKTWAGIDSVRAREIIDQYIAMDKVLVMKPMFGSQGQGLQLIDREHTEPEFNLDTVYYLQEFVNNRSDQGHWCDWRLFVVGGKVVAAVERVNDHWVNNVAQGSQCRVGEVDAQMIRYAENAAQSVDAAYAGVDLIRDQQGRIWVIEVNSIPAWKGVQSVVSNDIADILAVDLLRRL